MGDCDNDDQCLPNHVCPSNNGPQFGKPPKCDICVHDHCANGVQDSDEARRNKRAQAVKLPNC